MMVTCINTQSLGRKMVKVMGYMMGTIIAAKQLS